MGDRNFWKGKKVFVTGHTGFKGSWLCLYLHSLGADVTGYALNPPTVPSLFELCAVGGIVRSLIADIRDREALARSMSECGPEVVIHMAAQPLVLESYRNPIETYDVNVMGTVSLLEALRKCAGVRAVVNVTTDKCYENSESYWGYREKDPLGGYDPYSASKACSEIVTASYRRSFFAKGVPAVATARAGNVIGGGDWASDRLLSDCARSLLKGEKIIVRNPLSVRPWQHVLEPLTGYLMLAERLCEEGAAFSGAWNFGPSDDDAKPVEWIAGRMCERWGEGASFERIRVDNPHEAHYLRLDCSKARAELGWNPVWSLETSLEKVVDWLKVYRAGGDVRAACLEQIKEYRAAGKRD